jgi:hypothetical protein
MIHGWDSSSVTRGVLGNGEAGLMGSGQAGSVVGICWLHLTKPNQQGCESLGPESRAPVCGPGLVRARDGHGME